MTKITSDDIWANGSTTTRPPSGKQATGFECGDADPDHFDWLFKFHAEVLLTLSDAFDAFVINTAQTISALETNLSTKTTQIADLFGRVTRIPSTIQTGMIEIATETEVAAGFNNTTAVTPFNLQAGFDHVGVLSKFMSADSNVWERANPPDPVPLTNTYNVNFTDEQGAKGFYLATVRVPEQGGAPAFKYNVPFSVYWVDGIGNDDPLRLDFRVPLTTGDLYLRIYAENITTASFFNVALRRLTDNGIAEVTQHELRGIYRLKLPAV